MDPAKRKLYHTLARKWLLTSIYEPIHRFNLLVQTPSTKVDKISAYEMQNQLLQFNDNSMEVITRGQKTCILLYFHLQIRLTLQLFPYINTQPQPQTLAAEIHQPRKQFDSTKVFMPITLFLPLKIEQKMY